MLSLSNPFERLPWWVFVAVGSILLLLAGSGFLANGTTKAPPPRAVDVTGAELVDLAKFTPELHAGKQASVNLAVQINDRHYYDLADFGGQGVLVVLFGASDGLDAPVARAAIVTADWTALTQNLEQNVLGSGVFGALYQLTGTLVSDHPQANAVHAAIDVAGLTVIDGFSLISPDGGARLASTAADVSLLWQVFLAAFGCLVIIFGLRLRHIEAAKTSRRDALFAAHQQNLHTPAE